MSRLRTHDTRTECEDRARILEQNSQKLRFWCVRASLIPIQPINPLIAFEHLSRSRQSQVQPGTVGQSQVKPGTDRYS